jgi:serine/threonine-protein kinase
MSDRIHRLTAALEGRYAIDRELGEGGMATVYLARDLKHNRNVALKVLKPELAAVVGAERFLAEIETTANLQHPGILPLYDSGEADGFLYYVMPYVVGESLRDRLDEEKQLSVEEAVRITTSVAQALDFAHEQGVVHRDIKPGNILFQGGQPVVGDFGIALAVGAGGGARLTETGLSVGTPYYMSPEQATGDQRVGPRSDIYSLGCMLYEMLVGDPPYMGSTAQAVLGQIIAGEPVTARARRSAVPPHVDAAIRRALEKLPADRFDTARAFAEALANPAFRHGEAVVGRPTPGRSTWLRRGHAAATVALAVAVVALASRAERDSAEARTVRFTVPIAPLADTTHVPGGMLQLPRIASRAVAISPQGDRLAYVASDGNEARLYLHHLDQGRTRLVAEAVDPRSPFFSPDGDWIGYFSATGLMRVNPGSGEVETIVPMDEQAWRGEATWGDDDSIVYATYGGLSQVQAAGGTPAQVASAERALASGPAEDFASPQLLPGARGLLFHQAQGTNPEEASVRALDLQSGVEHLLVDSATAPRYLSSGHLLFMRSGTLMGLPFDPESLEVSGEPRVLVEDVMHPIYTSNTNTLTFESQVAVSAAGDLVYLTGGVTPEQPRRLRLFRPDGSVESLDLPDREYAFARYSPDGSRLAFHAGPGARDEISVHTFATGVTQPLRLDGFSVQQPLWSPDGEWLLFRSDGTTYRVRSDGREAPERLYPDAPRLEPSDWSSDGVHLLFNREDGDLWVAAPGSEPAPFFTSPALETDASFSPDGRWVAYVSQPEAGAPYSVHVRAYPGPEPVLQISDGPGLNPAWSPDGDRVYYVDYDVEGRGLMAVDLDLSEGLRAGRPYEFLEHNPCCRFPLRGYDVAPDGSILNYVSVETEPELVTEFQVWLGFAEELRDRFRP